MKVQINLNGYLPASGIVIADVPDDITEDELDAIRYDLLVGELEADGYSEVEGVEVGDILPDHAEAEVRVVRQGNDLAVELPVDVK